MCKFFKCHSQEVRDNIVCSECKVQGGFLKQSKKKGDFKHAKCMLIHQIFNYDHNNTKTNNITSASLLNIRNLYNNNKLQLLRILNEDKNLLNLIIIHILMKKLNDEEYLDIIDSNTNEVTIHSSISMKQKFNHHRLTWSRNDLTHLLSSTNNNVRKCYCCSEVIAKIRMNLIVCSKCDRTINQNESNCDGDGAEKPCGNSISQGNGYRIYCTRCSDQIMYDNFVPTNPELIVDLRNFYSKANEDPNIIFDYDFVDQTLAFRETNIDEPSCSFICTGRTSYPPINFSEQYFSYVMEIVKSIDHPKKPKNLIHVGNTEMLCGYNVPLNTCNKKVHNVENPPLQSLIWQAQAVNRGNSTLVTAMSDLENGVMNIFSWYEQIKIAETVVDVAFLNKSKIHRQPYHRSNQYFLLHGRYRKVYGDLIVNPTYLHGTSVMHKLENLNDKSHLIRQFKQTPWVTDLEDVVFSCIRNMEIREVKDNYNCKRKKTATIIKSNTYNPVFFQAQRVQNSPHSFKLPHKNDIYC